MSRAAVIGEEPRVVGYGLAGVEVHPAGDAGAVAAAWDALPDDVACVILTPSALALLGERLAERPRVVWTVLPR